MKFEEIPFPCAHNDNFKLRIYYDLPKLEYAVVIYLNILQNPLTLYTDPTHMVPLRIHSSCLTGDIFHSKKCDCGDQLNYSMDYINKCGIGMLIYLPQEGRGIGLVNKIKAYKLQLTGLTTYEANNQLGFKDDERDFSVCLNILKDFKIRNIELLTSNPDKFRMFQRDPYIFNFTTKVIPINENKHNKKYLDEKKLFFARI